jgi:hypothetical protein
LEGFDLFAEFLVFEAFFVELALEAEEVAFLDDVGVEAGLKVLLR